MPFGYPSGRRQLRQAGLGALGAQSGHNIYRSLPALGRSLPSSGALRRRSWHLASRRTAVGASLRVPDRRQEVRWVRLRWHGRGGRPAALFAGKQPSSRRGCHVRPVAIWSASPRPAAARSPATQRQFVPQGSVLRPRCSLPRSPLPRLRTRPEPTSAPSDQRVCLRPWPPMRRPASRRPTAGARRRPLDAHRISTPRRPCDSTTTRQQCRPPPPCSRLGPTGSASSNHPRPEPSLDGLNLDEVHGRTSTDVQPRLDIDPSPPPVDDFARVETGRSRDVRQVRARPRCGSPRVASESTRTPLRRTTPAPPGRHRVRIPGSERRHGHEDREGVGTG